MITLIKENIVGIISFKHISTQENDVILHNIDQIKVSIIPL